MKRQLLVHEVLSALQNRNWQKVTDRLTNDFCIRGSGTGPITKEYLMRLHEHDEPSEAHFYFQLMQIMIQGSKAIARVHLVSDMPVNPSAELEFNFVGDLISKLEIKVSPNPLMEIRGVLEQLNKADHSNDLPS